MRRLFALLIAIVGIGVAIVFKKPEPQEPDHYFEVKLTPVQRRALLEVLDGKSIGGALRNHLIEQLKKAARFDVVEGMNWQRHEEEARRRGSSIVDYIFDKR